MPKPSPCEKYPTPRPLLSVIIPTLNEAHTLPALLDSLHPQAEGVEILIADGGSQDDTLSIARAAGLRVIPGPRGRGAQMNRGAREARGTWLLFLHADSLMSNPRQPLLALRHLAEHPGQAAGHFPLRFAHTQPGNRRVYRYYEGKTRLCRPDCFNGDQGLLISREYFMALGGFDEGLPFLEDRRLGRKVGQWVLLPGEIITSARRFEREGLARRMVLNAIILAMDEIGFHPFLQHAPILYREQRGAEALDLLPFFQLFDRLNGESSRRERLSRWLDVGRYVGKNSWQLFFLLDVLVPQRLGSGRPFLRLWEILAVLTRPLWWLAIPVVTGAVWLWFYGSLRILKGRGSS